jgi:hypothetical protein
VLFMSLLVAVTDMAWIEGIGQGIVGTALSLRTMSSIRRSERVNRDLVDQALRGEIPMSMPPNSDFEPAFQDAVDAMAPLQTARRLHCCSAETSWLGCHEGLMKLGPSRCEDQVRLVRTGLEEPPEFHVLARSIRENRELKVAFERNNHSAGRL